jgi:Dyp-type peroxidase family
MISDEGFTWPDEPVLEMDDIQGVAVPGFFKPHQMLLGVRFSREANAIRDAKKLLASLACDLATAAQTLADRRAHRSRAKGAAPFKPLLAVGFTFQGLFALTPGAIDIPSAAFRVGMPGRSALLGDAVKPGDAGHPSTWVVGAPGDELDMLLVVAGDDRESVRERAADIESRLLDVGASVDRQPGDVRDDVPHGIGREHFGFDDGVSQPGIRGRASDAPDDFITERYIDKSQVPAAALFGYPGQDLVWPGEFVLGYPKTGPDPLIAGPIEPAVPAWTRNGSFLVYRRLLQDVHLFWQTIQKMAGELSTRPGFDGIDELSLASRLVGRWPSGAPVSRTAAGDDPKLGDNPMAVNHFRFDCDTSHLVLTTGDDPFPQAKADPIGLTCPLAAHIRKVNTRDAPSDMGARSSTYERRVLRVGVAFGPSVEDPNVPPPEDDPERGLLFLSIQSSIDQQFEFLQARWINDSSRPKAPSGNDMLVGQNAPTADGVRRCTLFGEALQAETVEAPGQFVTASGGGYFFIPSLTALRSVLTA